MGICFYSSGSDVVQNEFLLSGCYRCARNGWRADVGRFLNSNRRVDAISAWLRQAAYVTKPVWWDLQMLVNPDGAFLYFVKLVAHTHAVSMCGFCRYAFI